ncbi:MAG: protein kinase, partial [Gemmatimonadota bacterium]|nr:protein kinase [Gemmatimonadota bacterium]
MDDLEQRLATALQGRYQLTGRAGQGGMATVFKALDLKHGRPVAIKVLRADISAAIGGERFLREIEVSAKLQHPHIVPLYDSGEAGGILYYVMPFVEGESLRDRLTREHRVPFPEAVTLIREVASALAYAHQQGIVHRDIKPENIMLSGGHAVVADFGIARALSAAQQGAGANMTGIGFAIGTPAYMSPEQATASEVDGRSDQYALGCVFYEMVTGGTPFAGQTVQAVLSKSLTGPRPRLSKVSREVPADADGPVARALDADPGRRFDSVTAFAAALEQAAGGGAGGMAERRRLRRLVVGLPLAVAAVAALAWFLVPRGGGVVVEGAETVAVLPFNASGPGVELMGEGMVDLLSTNLNAVGGIRAAEPRAILAAWKKRGDDGGDIAGALRIARDVKARSVLLGSIVATGTQVRLSAELYGQDGKNLARAQVDGSADSVLALVDSLSLRLVREIWRSNGPVPSVRVSGLTTGSLAAMREYLVGEQYYRRSTWDSAAAAFNRAIGLDSTFALAHYRLAATVGWSGGLGLADGLKASDAARRFSDRLPPRERSLVIAYNLFQHQRLEATDSARAYVAQYPDDVDGWFLLGETQYHTRQLVGYDPATLRAPFDSVLARDSTLTPASIHPLEIALQTRDRSRYDAYARVLQSSANQLENQAYRGAGELVFGKAPPDSATLRAMFRYGGSTGAAQVAISGGDEVTSDSVLNRLQRFEVIGPRTGTGQLQFLLGRGLVLAGLGQLDAARAVFDSARMENPDQAGAIMMWPLMIGFAPKSYAPELVTRLHTEPRRNPFQVYFQAIIRLSGGERVEGTRLLDSLLAHRDPKMPPKLYDLVGAAKGWTTMMAGDTAAGIRQMRTGLEGVGSGWNSFMTAPVRLQLATALAQRPDTREEGRRLLQYGFVYDAGISPVTQYALGRIEDAAGNKAAAIDAYSRFLKLWDKADPSLQPRITEAKEALARL